MPVLAASEMIDINLSPCWKAFFSLMLILLPRLSLISFVAPLVPSQTSNVRVLINQYGKHLESHGVRDTWQNKVSESSALSLTLRPVSSATFSLPPSFVAKEILSLLSIKETPIMKSTKYTPHSVDDLVGQWAV